jgi:hypothetical protein
MKIDILEKNHLLDIEKFLEVDTNTIPTINILKIICLGYRNRIILDSDSHL